jgi:biopolymer transport protein ExbB
MKPRTSRGIAAGIALLVIAGAACAQGNFDEALKREAAEYTARLRQAGEELNRARERISGEKAPLLAEIRETGDRLIALEHETSRLATAREEFTTGKRKLLHEIDELRRNNTYLTSLASDGLKALADGVAPGEDALVVDRLQALQDSINAALAEGGGAEAIDAAEFLLGRAQRMLGGHLEPGRAMNTADNRVLEGTFAFAGPEVFFRPAGGGQPGAVRLREGSRLPVYFPLRQWSAEGSEAFFSGRQGLMVADSSGGKALRLEQNAGTVMEHIEKGGKVAYAIVLVGIFAVLLIVQKAVEIHRLGADSSLRVGRVLGAVANGARDEARAALAGLRPATRALLEEGLRNIDQPRAILEERIESFLMANRLQLERRLPMLAVIATAAPLMGLLGTVVGMVKTFSLMTVFGTGNAAKLSTGISEVLVATELGLAVAIPALVIHGFLASRAHKHIALQDRHALEFVTAVEVSRMTGGRTPEAQEVRT